MKEEMKNKEEELSEEETGEVSGGVKKTIIKSAYCKNCHITYLYEEKEIGVVPPHNCPPNILSERNKYN